MNLLAATLYDPSTAATKATTGAAVMAVLDSTNLSLAVTVPAHGMLRVIMRTVLDGATTMPQVLLGVMNHTGGAVLGRVAPMAALGGTALATTHVPLVAEFTITGLTPGALTLDAAFGVELGVASTAIRWGGPNNTTASDAWGAFVFEIWDPRPLPTAAPAAVGGLLTSPTTANVGTVDVTRWNGSAVPAPNVSGVPIVDDKYLLGTIYSTPATAGIQDVNVKNIDNDAASASGTVTFPNATLASTTNITAGTITTATNLTNNNDKTGYALSSGGVQAIWDALTSALTTVGSIGKLLVTNLDATVSSRSTYAGGAVASVTAGVTVTTNNDKSGYSLSTAGILAIWHQLTSAIVTAGTIGKLIIDYLDAAISSRSTYAGGAVASVTGSVGSVTGLTASDVGAIKTQTDKMAFTVANQLDVNVLGIESADPTNQIRDSIVNDATRFAGANIDAAISSRSTYAGGDTAGTTTLLSRLTAARAGYLDVLNGIVAAIWAAVTDSSGVTTLLSRLTSGRATKLDNLDAAITTRAVAGDAMTLTSGERTSIANEVEAQIIDDTDSEKVLQAITDKIAAVNPDLGSLSVGAIATAVRDKALAGAVAGSIGEGIANLQTSVDDIPTNAELATALGGLNDVSTADVQTAAEAALAAYDAPTNTDLTTALGTLNDLSPTDVEDAVWEATMADHLTSGTTGASLNGAGSAGDPWGTTLPGSYAEGTAGNIIGNRLDAAVSSRATPGDAMALTQREGRYVFSEIPVDGDIISFNGNPLVFRDTPVDPTDIEIASGVPVGGATLLGLTLVNLRNYLNASLEPALSCATYQDNGTEYTIGGFAAGDSLIVTLKPETEIIYTLDTNTSKIRRSAASIGTIRAIGAEVRDHPRAGAAEGSLGEAIHEIHQIQGLDIANPLTVTPTSMVTGDVEIAITGDGTTTSTATRQ